MAAERHTRRDVDQWWDALDLDDLTPPHQAPPPPGHRDRSGAARHRDWADELEERLSKEPAAPGPIRVRPVRRGRGVLVGAAVAGLVAAGSLAVTTGGSEDGDSDSAGVTLVPATSAPTLRSVAPTTAPRCPTRIEGDTVTGAGRGGTGSGPEAILAFENAYYIERSGAAARTFTTAEASVPVAEVIQAGIDSVPAGTTHCVRISPAGPDTWAVDLSEYRPGEGPQLYLQTITTTRRDDKVLITGIGQR
ncbi:hypothetical protein ACFWPH_28135 [Nocardia sp. NPDC058499]|uniref:hypothetical protein n=1 Tax=Nocardia sp. NPDC058499 TaxID=3346530 RepID=UPI00364E93EE